MLCLQRPVRDLAEQYCEINLERRRMLRKIHTAVDLRMQLPEHPYARPVRKLSVSEPSRMPLRRHVFRGRLNEPDIRTKPVSQAADHFSCIRPVYRAGLSQPAGFLSMPCKYPCNMLRLMRQPCIKGLQLFRRRFPPAGKGGYGRRLRITLKYVPQLE